MTDNGIRVRGASLVTHDAAAELSPTARRILAAARRVLGREGFKGLTLEAIAAEAGENKASIRYHFGNKAGLVGALADSVVHDENIRLLRELSKASADHDRVDILIEQHLRVVTNLRQYRLFFDLFPNLIRDPSLWPRMAELFDWYRELDIYALEPEADDELRERLRLLTALTVAVCDGLAMQYAADQSFDVEPVLHYWAGLIRHALEQARDGAGVPAGDGP
ncbi:MAG TPA: helix-turn-helix domain-containing protein [Thermoleophilia bacterium]|nr:helix-turn-helix domain-containing protein [Thermoleophilia bacterium]